MLNNSLVCGCAVGPSRLDWGQFEDNFDHVLFRYVFLSILICRYVGIVGLFCLCCVWYLGDNAQITETLSTLRFGERAKRLVSALSSVINVESISAIFSLCVYLHYDGFEMLFIESKTTFTSMPSCPSTSIRRCFCKRRKKF